MDGLRKTTTKENNIRYQGVTDEEAYKLTYFILNCLDIADGELENLYINYSNGLLTASGCILDRVLKYFSCRLDYDGNSLTIISNIKEGEESYNTTDTFYFEPDNILVVSNLPGMDKESKIKREISYISEHRKI